MFPQDLTATTVTEAISGGVGRKNDAKPTMVFTANDLSKWENFPKGLRVLLLNDGDDLSAAETRSELESLDYIGEPTNFPLFLSFTFYFRFCFDYKKVI